MVAVAHKRLRCRRGRQQTGHQEAVLSVASVADGRAAGQVTEHAAPGWQASTPQAGKPPPTRRVMASACTRGASSMISRALALTASMHQFCGRVR